MRKCDIINTFGHNDHSIFVLYLFRLDFSKHNFNIFNVVSSAVPFGLCISRAVKTIYRYCNIVWSFKDYFAYCFYLTAYSFKLWLIIANFSYDKCNVKMIFTAFRISFIIGIYFLIYQFISIIGWNLCFVKSLGEGFGSFAVIRLYSKIFKQHFHIHQAVCSYSVCCCWYCVVCFVIFCFYGQEHINVLKEHKHHKALYSLKAVVVFCICSECIAYSRAFKLKLNGDFFNRKSVRIYKFGSCSDNCAVFNCVWISALTGIDIVFRYACCLYFEWDLERSFLVVVYFGKDFRICGNCLCKCFLAVGSSVCWAVFRVKSEFEFVAVGDAVFVRIVFEGVCSVGIYFCAVTQAVAVCIGIIRVCT